MKQPRSAPLPFTGYQKFVVALLAFLQFTIILDFMILSPLGALIMPALKMTTAQFGLVVSAYAFSAGISGLLAAGFADKFDRKRLLLFFYAGFTVGTLLCALSPTFEFLFFARVLTGLFGGVIGSIVFAITTDLFPLEQRGRVMGYVQTAFAASQVMGIPMAIYLSNRWGWHAPFLMIVAVSVFVGAIIAMRLEPIDGHLGLQTQRSAFGHLTATVTNRRYLFAFAATALLSVGGFMLMPFGSAFTVNNPGIAIEHLPMIYLITGICAIFIGPLVGKASDRYGRLETFAFGTVLAAVMVVIYTNLGVTPLWLVILVNAVMFVGVFSRMIPSQALMSAIPSPASRGSFMSVSASLQQIAGGFASMIAGLIVVQEPSGHLGRFPVLGYVVVGSSLITFMMIFTMERRMKKETKLAPPPKAEDALDQVANH